MNKKEHILNIPEIPLLGTNPRKMDIYIYVHQDICRRIYLKIEANLLIVAKNPNVCQQENE